MIPLDAFLPQGEAIAALKRQIRENRLTHALLISGEAGVGKWTLARTAAAALLCEGDPAGPRPCGACRACEQMENLSHPDLIVMRKGEPLAPTETKTVIPVTDVEEMIRRLSLRGFQNDRHCVIIRHAEDMNEAAQNKLLKTQEEPPEGTFFLLTCVHTEQLLPTIVSRCRPLKLHAWPAESVAGVLRDHGFAGEKAAEAVRESGGSFGRALRMMEDEDYWTFRAEAIRDFLGCERRSDIFSIAARWKDRKGETDALFSVLESVFSRMMRTSLGIAGAGEKIPDCPEKWQRFAARAGAEDYVKVLDALSLARKRTMSSVPFQAAAEQLILSLMEAVDR